MSRILNIINYGDFQWIEQTREPNQIRHVPSNTFVHTAHSMTMQVMLAAMHHNGDMEARMRKAYEDRGGNYAA